MSILRDFRRLTPRLLGRLHYGLPLSSLATAATVTADVGNRASSELWTPAPISRIEPAAESLFHIRVDLSESPELAASHTAAGQYLQLRVPHVSRPTFLAIASPPSFAAEHGAFEFLVKAVNGSIAELLCGLNRGDVVELSEVMGRGFDIGRIQPPGSFPTVLLFATGAGISPLRSLIESGFDADRRTDVRLYYGARNLRRMAYQDRFKDWEFYGIKIVPVLSQPDVDWTGETGFVQAAFLKAKRILNPQGTGAVLCGLRPMTQEVTSILVGDGVSRENILKNV